MTCAHCEDLKEEIAYLKSELGLQVDSGQVAAIRDAFGLTEQKARILLVLYKARARTISIAQFHDALPCRYGKEERSEKLVQSSISQLRKIVGADAVDTLYGQGYRLGQRMRARIDAILMRDRVAA